jgi:hypothetical protein
VAERADLGRAFAEAIAAKDFAAVESLLHPEVDFAGLTASRSWTATGPEQVVVEVLRHWFDEHDVIDATLAIETATVADRSHLAYRLSGHNRRGPFVVEQQAYLTAEGGRIGWMRVLCSGFRPA